MGPCLRPTRVVCREGAMKPKPRQSVLVALLLTVGLSLLVVGCMGGGQGTTTTLSAATTQELGQLPVSSQTGTSVSGMNAEALSTFKSKDPFIQQALPPPRLDHYYDRPLRVHQHHLLRDHDHLLLRNHDHLPRGQHDHNGAFHDHHDRASSAQFEDLVGRCGRNCGCRDPSGGQHHLQRQARG